MTEWAASLKLAFFIFFFFFFLAPFVKEGSVCSTSTASWLLQTAKNWKSCLDCVWGWHSFFFYFYPCEWISVRIFLFCFVYFRNYPVLMEKGFFFSPLPLFCERIKTLCHPMISALLKPVNRLLSRFYSESNELFGVHGNNSKGSYLNCGRYWHTTAQ